MALGHPIQLRLSPDKHLAYEEDAARHDKPLATYLRERLEASDDLRSELAALRQDIANLRHAFEDQKQAAPQDPTQSLLAEILLMLRAVGGPDRTKTVRAELARLGYALWTPEERRD
jgi:hypothetical protein